MEDVVDGVVVKNVVVFRMVVVLVVVVLVVVLVIVLVLVLVVLAVVVIGMVLEAVEFVVIWPLQLVFGLEFTDRNTIAVGMLDNRLQSQDTLNSISVELCRATWVAVGGEVATSAHAVNTVTEWSPW